MVRAFTLAYHLINLPTSTAAIPELVTTRHTRTADPRIDPLLLEAR